MVRQYVAVLTLLIFLHVSNVSLAGQKSIPAKDEAQYAGIKAEVGLFRPGSNVEVKLRDGQKLRGRLGNMTGDSFELQPVKNGISSARTVAFRDVRSIRSWSPFWGNHKKTWLIVLAVVGGLMAVFVGLASGES